MFLNNRVWFQAFDVAFIVAIFGAVCIVAPAATLAATRVPQWQVVELEFTSDKDYENAYTNVEFWVDFKHANGMQLRRPGFWDGGRSFKVRFASPLGEGNWSWISSSNVADHGLNDRSGTFQTGGPNGSTPVKAIANGEPTYENIGMTGRAAGWWQGHEAWRNLCAGGTMGIVYGAGSLWNWVHPGEPEQNDGWARAPKSSWRDALDFEGSNYAGMLGKILDGLPLDGAQPDNSCTYGRPSLFKPNQLLILYLENGGGLLVLRDDIPDVWRIYDPKTSEIVRSGRLSDSGKDLGDTGSGPRVVIFSNTY